MGKLPRSEENSVSSNDPRIANDATAEISRLLRILQNELFPGLIYQTLLAPDGAKRVTYISNAAALAHGVTREQVYSDPNTIYKQIHEEDLPRLHDAEATAIRTQQPFELELRFNLPAGELRWAILCAVPQCEPDGSMLWTGIEIDITERKKAEQALRESEGKYRWLVETSPDGMFLRDNNDQIAYINPAGLKILGATDSADVFGKRALDFVHSDCRASVMDRVSRILNYGEIAPPLEEKFVRLDGSLVDVEVTAAPYFLWGKPGIQVLFRDITKRKQEQNALYSQAEEIRWLMKSMANAFIVWGTVFDEHNRLVDIRFDYFNDAYEKVCGLKLAEVQGKTVREVWPATEQGWFDIYGEVACTGETKKFEMYHAPTHGLYSCTAYRPFATRTQVCCVFEDITERKKASEDREASEVFLNTIIEHSPHSMWISDSSGTLIRMNQACRDMFHITDAEVVGKYNILEDSALEQQNLLPLIRNIYEHGETARFTFFYNTDRTQTAHSETPLSLILETTISPVLDPQKRVANAIIQHVDITERIRAESALRYQQGLEHLITEISSRFINLDPEDIGDAIQSALKAIGEFAGADRSYLFFIDSGITRAENTHEWCAENIASDMMRLQNLKLEDCPIFSEPILRSEIVHFPRVADLPSNSVLGILAEALKDIKSLLLIPIEYGHRVIGCLGLDAVREERTWPAEIMGLLRVAGEVLAGALERKRSMEARRESELFLQQVIDNAPFGAHFYHLQNNERLVFTKANKTADQMLQISQAALIGKTIEEAFPGLANTNIPSIYKDIARSGESYTQEQIDYDESGIKGAFEINAFQTVPDHMAVFFVDITKRKQTEAAFAEEAARRRVLFEQSPDGILIIDPQTMKFLDFNAAAHQQLGYSRKEFAQLSIPDVEASETYEETRARISRVIHEGKLTFETIQRTRQGDLRNIHVTAQTVEVLGRSLYQCIWRDITEQKHAEEERKKLQLQLAQSQKMESVGRLAGGVAHDFNNMLGVIIGHTELALDQVPADQPLHADLEEIRRAAQRSADLTRQLLAFARKQTVNPKVLNLNDSIATMLKMLRRLIGENVELEWAPDADLRPVKVDPTQLDQILANLCVNSRDAISGVGKIIISTRNAIITATDCTLWPDAVPGEYSLLMVKDTGCGMSTEVLEHLFEPFFTTKDIGRGTGLGLATVYGIVRQNEGFIHVYSEPGKGTEFKIYLPQATTSLSETLLSGSVKAWQSHGEIVLLVEDEQALLKLSRSMLQKMGFIVLAAGSPEEAIQQAKTSGKIDLLITDVVMPGMNGRDLSARILKMNPNLKCLFMSGYTADVIAHQGVLEEGVHFIQKPFSLKDLTLKIRETLEQG